MAYRELPFVGVISADSIVKENFIIAGGNFASASNQISDFNVSSGDEFIKSRSNYLLGCRSCTYKCCYYKYKW